MEEILVLGAEVTMGLHFLNRLLGQRSIQFHFGLFFIYPAHHFNLPPPISNLASNQYDACWFVLIGYQLDLFFLSFFSFLYWLVTNMLLTGWFWLVTFRTYFFLSFFSFLWFASHQYAACWLVLIGYLLDLADGAVARRLDACSALGEWSQSVSPVKEWNLTASKWYTKRTEDGARTFSVFSRISHTFLYNRLVQVCHIRFNKHS